MTIKYKVLVEIELEFASEFDANHPQYDVNYIANKYAEMSTMYASIAANWGKVVLVERKP